MGKIDGRLSALERRRLVSGSDGTRRMTPAEMDAWLALRPDELPAFLAAIADAGLSPADFGIEDPNDEQDNDAACTA